MNNDKTFLPPTIDQSNPHKPDVDDLIFQGEGWMISDR